LLEGGKELDPIFELIPEAAENRAVTFTEHLQALKSMSYSIIESETKLSSFSNKQWHFHLSPFGNI
jgi:hypothetical protein